MTKQITTEDNNSANGQHTETHEEIITEPVIIKENGNTDTDDAVTDQNPIMDENEVEPDDPENEAAVDTGEKRVEIQYREGVVKEPRDEEEMDLGLLDSQAAADVYLDTSDDRGKLINDEALYNEIKNYCKRYPNIDDEDLDHLEIILQESKELITKFGMAINVSENTIGGTVTKYRLWMGKILLIEQAAAKKVGYTWKVWFKRNYENSFFRSAEDYMRLARVPEIIRYSVFGKERLLGIIRLIDDLNTKDPVGEFLNANGFSYDPLTETDVFEIRRQADVAVNFKKLADAEISGVTRDQIEAYVRNGKEIGKRQIDFLKAGDDSNVQMNKLIASDGKVEPIMTPKHNADIFKKATDNLMGSIAKAVEDAEYLASLDPETYNNLKQKVLDLEPLINRSSNQ